MPEGVIPFGNPKGLSGLCPEVKKAKPFKFLRRTSPASESKASPLGTDFMSCADGAGEGHSGRSPPPRVPGRGAYTAAHLCTETGLCSARLTRTNPGQLKHAKNCPGANFSVFSGRGALENRDRNANIQRMSVLFIGTYASAAITALYVREGKLSISACRGASV